MKNLFFAARAWFVALALNVLLAIQTWAMSFYRQYLCPKEIRRTLIAVVLSMIPVGLALAPDLAMAQQSLSDLGVATGLICLISDYISGPWLYGIGIVLIIFGAVAIGSSESTIMKMLSTVLMGLGIASCAIPIVKNHMNLNYTC